MLKVRGNRIGGESLLTWRRRVRPRPSQPRRRYLGNPQSAIRLQFPSVAAAPRFAAAERATRLPHPATVKARGGWRLRLLCSC